MQQEKKYQPACCEHKLPNGLGSWMFHSESSGSGPDMYHNVHVSVCLQCGTIRIGGFRQSKGGKTNRFNEEFSIHATEAIDAMVKYANYIHEAEVWGRLPQQLGTAIWVKASARLPDKSGHITWRWLDKTEAYAGYDEKKGFIFGTGGARVDPTYYSEIEWLDEETGQSNKDDANVSKEQFLSLNKWLSDGGYSYDGEYYYNEANDFFTPEQLYEQYNQQKEGKP
jgi:hypothetical protein